MIFARPRLASSKTLLCPGTESASPIAIDSLTATVFSECASAVTSGSGAHVAVLVIVRTPVADADRRIDDDGRRLELAGHQRGQIDEGLERGAGLAQRVGRAVELARAIIAPAHHRPHAARRVEDHHRALLGVIARPVLAQQLILDRLLGVLLERESSAVRTVSTRSSPSFPASASRFTSS